MKMFILGEIAELAIVDTHGLIVEGDTFEVQVQGTSGFPAGPRISATRRRGAAGSLKIA